jgi:tetratricopeptide (TPR) repeat protein
VMASLAKLRIDHGEYSSARRLLDAAVAICRAAHCLRVEAQVVYRLAELHLATGRIKDALQALHRTLRVVRDLGDRTGEAYALLSLGVVRTREGRPDSAHTTLTHALRLAREVGDRWVEGQALFELGQHAVVWSGRAEAHALLARAIELFATLDAPLWRAKCLVVRAELYAADGEHATARAAAEQAGTLLAGLGSTEADQWAYRAGRLGGAPSATAQCWGGGAMPGSGGPKLGGKSVPQCASA